LLTSELQLRDSAGLAPASLIEPSHPAKMNGAFREKGTLIVIQL